MKKIFVVLCALACMQPVGAMRVIKISEEEQLAIETEDPAHAVKRVLGGFLKKVVTMADISDANACAVIESLLAAGADLNQEDENDYYGKERLVVDAIRCKPKVAKLLLERGAPAGEKALFEIALIGSLELCKLILQREIDVNVENMLGETPLHWAAEHGHFKIFFLFFSHNADIHHKTKDGSTPLHKAAWGARRFYSHDPSTKYRYFNGGEYEAICRVLVAAGADRNAKTIPRPVDPEALHLKRPQQNDNPSLSASSNTAYDYYPKFEFLKPDETR